MKNNLFVAAVIVVLSIIPITEQSDKEYGDLFTSLQDDETIETKAHDGEYVCIRKYVIEGHLTTHQIDENPKKINMFDVDCKEVIRTARGNAADTMASDEYLSEDQKKCVRRKFINGKHFDAMAVAVALRQSTLSPNQMVEEKTKFIEKMNEMSKSLNECVMKKKKKEEKKDEKKEEEKRE
ncbi:hypothetical protein ACKWTF_001816 [Chironomus riparius]